MALAAFIVAVAAAVIALASAAYTRTQALAAKGDLALEKARRQDELTPRLEASFSAIADDRLVLELRLLPQQPPMAGVRTRIVEGTGVAFDTEPYAAGGGTVSAWHTAMREAMLAPGSTVRWPVSISTGDVSQQVVLEVSDLADASRVAAITVDTPPRQFIW